MLRGELRQRATYWAPATVDGFGKKTFAEPVLLSCRWEDRTDLVIQGTEEARPSKARVFLNQAVALGG